MKSLIYHRKAIKRCYKCPCSFRVTPCDLTINKKNHLLECTKVRPHILIANNYIIPEWCPLPDSKFWDGTLIERQAQEIERLKSRCESLQKGFDLNG